MSVPCLCLLPTELDGGLVNPMSDNDMHRGLKKDIMIDTPEGYYYRPWSSALHRQADGGGCDWGSQNRRWIQRARAKINRPQYWSQTVMIGIGRPSFLPPPRSLSLPARQACDLPRRLLIAVSLFLSTALPDPSPSFDPRIPVLPPSTLPSPAPTTPPRLSPPLVEIPPPLRPVLAPPGLPHYLPLPTTKKNVSRGKKHRKETGKHSIP